MPERLILAKVLLWVDERLFWIAAGLLQLHGLLDRWIGDLIAAEVRSRGEETE